MKTSYEQINFKKVLKSKPQPWLKTTTRKLILTPQKNKAPSPSDARDKYQIDKSKDRDYIETDVPESRLELVKNPRYNTMELTVKGNLTLIDPTFTRRK